MLNDLRNLLGRRDEGPTGFLTEERGEPLEVELAAELRRNDLGLEENSEPFDVGRRSWGGEAAKHSSSDGVWLKSPHPNWKAGSGALSWSLKETELVE